MTLVRKVLALLPVPLRKLLFRHRELLKFLTVGGTTFLVTTGVNYALKFTVLTAKPVTALIVATIVATIVSYVLNREWSFRTRGGRERHHEAALFFLISGVGIVLNSVPLGVSRYLLHLETPEVSLAVQEVADFLSSMIIGTLVATAFRWWAFRRWVFPLRGERFPDGRATGPEVDLGEAA
ncbi:GtrA family protein [Saccharothrix longispora]|uniref:Flippase GtrA n=1 Tax=Saccharothrix longispora TaxID=33920 RepID=A0ABU1PQM1_9PSEU|nr:GtrA family protein [Saccharothrix longispora]MDR6592955.1 putative flippase GtrA [Saccharothrix longispora]